MVFTGEIMTEGGGGGGGGGITIERHVITVPLPVERWGCITDWCGCSSWPYSRIPYWSQQWQGKQRFYTIAFLSYIWVAPSINSTNMYIYVLLLVVCVYGTTTNEQLSSFVYILNIYSEQWATKTAHYELKPFISTNTIGSPSFREG